MNILSIPSSIMTGVTTLIYTVGYTELGIGWCLLSTGVISAVTYVVVETLSGRGEKHEAQKLISTAVKTKEISREKAEELLINLETNKISPESIKAMFGEL